MNNWFRTIARLTLWGTPLVGGLVWANSAGPPEAKTGAPGEGTCADSFCHTGSAVNSGPGSFTITQLTPSPGQYAPGDTLDFRLDLQQSGQRRWGFEVTVLNSLGQPVGKILLTEPTRTQVSQGAGGRQYLRHTSLGTNIGTLDASPGWTFKWVAPNAGAGAVTFYGAGNAANGNGAVTGDFIYALSSVLTEGPQAAHEHDVRPESFALGANFPNPFNAGTRFAYRLDLPAAGPVSVDVFDIGGRHVRTLVDGRFEAPGEHELAWDGRDDRGDEAPSGTYLVRLRTRAGADTRKVMLLR